MQAGFANSPMSKGLLMLAIMVVGAVSDSNDGKNGYRWRCTVLEFTLDIGDSNDILRWLLLTLSSYGSLYL